MNFLKQLFKTKATKVPAPAPIEDKINRNYVCLSYDPIETVNDLRVGDWDMEKLQNSLSSGMLRYAKQSEVDKATELGRIKG